MKTLLILRHAKSSWDQPDREDFDRPLNKRGKRDAPKMAEHIAAAGLCPDLILASPARRTRKTADAVQRACGESVLTYCDGFYLGEPAAYLERLRALSDSIERVVVVGHNPGLETLAKGFCDSVDALPTCALAQIELPIESWNALTLETRGTLQGFWKPRDLK